MLVGPPSDPAGVEGLGNITLAMKKILENRSKFCSRGDDSGTHAKEKELWEAAGYSYSGIRSKENSTWYLSLGMGMGDTLRTASEKEAYTLSDEATFYALQPHLSLKIFVTGDPLLFNQYGVIPINQSDMERVHLAEEFAHWLTSPPTQQMIGEYEKYGHKLFTPNAGE